MKYIILLLDLFVGECQINSRAYIKTVLIDAIVKYKGSNKMIFGTNSDKAPQPIQVKKLVLVLLSSRILGYGIEKLPKEKESDEQKYNEMYAFLQRQKVMMVLIQTN